METLIKLSENIADEAQAVKGYIPLIQDKKLSASITEIIGDELAHLLVLTAMLVESGGFTISSDLKDAVEIIQKHIKKS